MPNATHFGDVVKDQKSFSGLQLLIRLQYCMLYYIAGISKYVNLKLGIQIRKSKFDLAIIIALNKVCRNRCWSQCFKHLDFIDFIGCKYI